MLWNFIKFELQYRSKRPATYIYFAILFLLSFFAISTDVVHIGGSGGMIKENSPINIAKMMLVLSAFFMMITSAIMGVPVLRDFENNTESLMFVNPIKKRDYLFGRFLGSYIVLIFVFSGCLFGFIIGEFMPWRDTEKLLPFHLWNYLQPFILFVLPNIFFTGALFFATGTLSRKMITIYTQAIVLLAFYLIISSITSDMETRTLGSLLDPFGISSVSNSVRYWSVSEKNALVVPAEGLVLLNRVIWLIVGATALFMTYLVFKFQTVRNSIFRKKITKTTTYDIPVNIAFPKLHPVFSTVESCKNIFTLAWFHFKITIRELPFIGIVLVGIVLLSVNAMYVGEMYGTKVYPVTYSMIELIDGFTFFFMIIIVYYSGEIIWKERSAKINLIYDALPVKDIVVLTGKLFSMIFIHIFLICILIATGIIIQMLYGYFNFEISLYIKSMFTKTLSMLILYTFLAFFIHVLVNHRFLGYALILVFFISVLVLNQLGVEHPMFQFSMQDLGTYSDMNGFGHFIPRFASFQIYWFALALVLFALTALFSVRGTDVLLRIRIFKAKQRFVRPAIIFTICSTLVFIASGSFIYYNTNILNRYRNSNTEKKLQADYEKRYKKFLLVPQPRITDVKLKIDLDPDTRYMKADGYFILKNKTNNPISEIHIQLSNDHRVTTENIKFSNDFSIKEKSDTFLYTIYNLTQPLNSGDSVYLFFTTVFSPKGFTQNADPTSILNNGTFFNNMDYFPTIGYNEGFEINSDDERKKQGLKAKERMMDRDNPAGLSMSLLGDDADRINLDLTLSTSADQIAIAPGYLQKEWTENGKRYFHYKMDNPILGFYSILSAKYEVLRDKWKNINLEIYYHNGHDYNLKMMIKAMKKSLDYYTLNFSPYPYKQLRILEFPRYQTFAQSFSNTIPFSEGIGFIMDVRNEDVDMSYYVTCHEIAHQWWAHQVTDANVKGNGMVSEMLSQYSALMVMKHEYSTELIQKYLRYEMDRYLQGRSMERKKEQPLELCEGQGYIHYNKGSVAMFAFQDYISEDSVNIALKRLVKDWAFREDRYVTSEDVLKYFRQVTPDSLQNIIFDLFQSITLFENKTNNAKAIKIDENKYKVTLDISASKMRADSLGNETMIPINDWIDIGIYEKDSDGKDKLLYLKKHKLTKSNETFEIFVPRKPNKAGIDPLNKLIDRHPDDNLKSISFYEKVISKTSVYGYC